MGHTLLKRMGISDAWEAAPARTRLRSRRVLFGALAVFAVGVAPLVVVPLAGRAVLTDPRLGLAVLVSASIGLCALLVLPPLLAYWIHRSVPIRSLRYETLGATELVRYLNEATGRDLTLDQWTRASGVGGPLGRVLSFLVVATWVYATLALARLAGDLVMESDPVRMLVTVPMLLGFVSCISVGWYVGIVLGRLQHRLHRRLVDLSMPGTAPVEA